MEVRYILLLPPSVEEILFSTPLIRSIIKDIDHSEVYCAVPKGFEWLLENNPYVSGQIIFDKKPSENMEGFRNVRADYLVDLTGGKNALWFKNRLKIMDFTLSYREISKIRALGELSKAFKLFLDLSFDLLRVFDLKYDDQGMDYFYGHNKSFIEKAIPESFIDGYALIDIPDMIGRDTDLTARLSDLISRIERPVVLCCDKKWKETGEEVMRRTGCTILSTCGDFNEQEKVFARAGSKVILNLKERQGIWSMIFDKPHYYFDLSQEPEKWRKEIDEIRQIISVR